MDAATAASSFTARPRLATLGIALALCALVPAAPVHAQADEPLAKLVIVMRDGTSVPTISGLSGDTGTPRRTALPCGCIWG